MSTILPKEPVIVDRESVIFSNAERRNIRRKLKGSLNVARDVLNPRNQLNRLVSKTAAQVKQVADETVQTAKKNAPVIGVFGLSAVLFAARGAISRWISCRRNSKANTPSGD